MSLRFRRFFRWAPSEHALRSIAVVLEDSMKIDLTGKTALVTGASRGIGEAIARRLAETGAHVLCAARSKGRVEEIAADLTSKGHRATGVELDITGADVRERVKALL